MAYVWAAVFIAAVVCISGSAQQGLVGEECEISHGLDGTALSGNATATSNCTGGKISWHYPSGEFAIRFPRTVLPDLAHARQKMRVCFQGVLGSGVESISQKLIRKRSVKTFNIKFVDSLTEWGCSRPSHSPAGIQVTLAATPEKYYLQVLNYRAEIVERKRKGGKGGKGGKGKKGGRRDKGRGGRRGKNKGNRRGKNKARGGKTVPDGRIDSME